jgi:hypothetical protein
VVLVAYLFEPNQAIAVRRPSAMKRSLEALGIRVTVIASRISGQLDDDESRRIRRTNDLRLHFETDYKQLIGYSDGAVTARRPQRWWSRAVPPDVTAVSWTPFAAAELIRVLRSDPADVVITTSPPEAAHLLGFLAKAYGALWQADFRDGWLFEAAQPRTQFRKLDRMLERLVVRGASLVTGVSEPIVADLRRRFGVDAHHITNGFDPELQRAATDETSTLDKSRFSLVHTGTLNLDAGDVLHGRGRAVRGFLTALRRCVDSSPALRTRLELVVAGTTTAEETQVLREPPLDELVRVVGSLPHARSLGLQHAADGLLLVVGEWNAATGKVFEYLAARKPILAVADPHSAAAELLDGAGGHVIATPTDDEALFRSVSAYLDRYCLAESPYEPNPEFCLDNYAFPRVAQRLVDLLVDTGAFLDRARPSR